MGTSRNSHELSKKLATFGTVGVPAAQRAGIVKVCQVGQRQLSGVLATEKALGKWANMKGRGSGVLFKIREVGGRSTGALWIFGAPAYIRNEGAPPHLITAKGSAKGKVRAKGATRAQASALFGFMAGNGGADSAKGAIAIPGIGVRRFARSPGLKGHHFFGPAATVIEEEAKGIARAEVAKEMAKAFR